MIRKIAKVLFVLSGIPIGFLIPIAAVVLALL